MDKRRLTQCKRRESVKRIFIAMPKSLHQRDVDSRQVITGDRIWKVMFIANMNQ
ncbi:MAG: hypothetical protein QHH06_10825 [Clostridiales bacterium]|nr:hypothetical protein [Eubacteriales bacterium]MDH7566960.1 hypothetical protein [Clostridiales bacterium]